MIIKFYYLNHDKIINYIHMCYNFYYYDVIIFQFNKCYVYAFMLLTFMQSNFIRHNYDLDMLWCQINWFLFDFVKLDMTSSKLNRVTWELVSFARKLTNLISHLYSRFNFVLLFVVSFFVLYIHQILSLL